MIVDLVVSFSVKFYLNKMFTCVSSSILDYKVECVYNVCSATLSLLLIDSRILIAKIWLKFLFLFKTQKLKLYSCKKLFIYAFIGLKYLVW